ncbi:DUF5047 domain-containing protein [Actinoplanes aureus]|uniref:DUF5047 domain-containing protein n=1 Tax=Actinoplanes aureus TaxID=2792083 RepID=A0A931C3K3_9ACTN|nr:DUF5047 domain-containing protein [Actinoplanes aureus]MBG0560732.1 DUF5047 domain-containing protein [Actinoplanes aureus]
MRPVSARFLRTLTGSHTAVFRARVVTPGQTGVTPTGVEVRILDGDVRLDSGQAIRSTLALEIDGTGLWPDYAGDPLTPYGNEIFVERGIAFGGGVVEWVSLGYHRINTVEQDDPPDGPIDIAAVDRMANIVDSKLTSPVQFAATVTYGDVVDQLVTDAYAAAVIEWDDPDVATTPIGRTVAEEKDRHKFLDDLITGLGKTWFFDHRGILVIRDLPDPSRPVWIVAQGEGGVLVEANRSLSRIGTYNGVLATGEGLDTQAPARGLAVDTNPSSPTRWGGPFGKVAREFSSPLLTSDAQAELAARTILRRSLGMPYNVDFRSIVNPALDPDDPIALGIEGAVQIAERELIMGDSFSRTVVDAIGTSESGHAWTTAGGPASDWQVAAGVLSKTNAANAASSGFCPPVIGRSDVNILVDIQVPNAATGASLVFGTLLRYSGGTSTYTARLEFNPGGTLTHIIAVHGSSYSEPAVLADFDTYTAGEWWTLRARARDTTIEIKAWRRGTPEPSEWTLAYDQATEFTGTRFGLYFWRMAGNTNTTGPQYRVDNWRVFNVPASPPRGDLHVIDTLTIPLTADAAMQATTREQALVTIGVL